MDVDIAVLGSGFGGAIASMIVRKLGYSTLLLERNTHPRFAIGESSTPFSNLLLEKLARDFELPELLPFTEWGRWQTTHPDIGCGLKRGFSFFHHQRHLPFKACEDRHNELLVAASPCDSLADTHWYRPDFDAHMVQVAILNGVEFMDSTSIISYEGLDSDRPVRLKVRRNSQEIELSARYVIDATGPRGALFKASGLDEEPIHSLPPTEALFSHFRGVSRWDELFPNISSGALPFPIDDAAVHHVFDGGWIWLLRFNNGIVSAGVAAEASFAKEFSFEKGVTAWNSILKTFPSIGALFENSSRIEPFRHLTPLSFRAARNHGLNWSFLPSAFFFLDPLLSTGFALTFLGISRLCTALKQYGLGNTLFQVEMNQIEKNTKRELDVTAGLIGALYRNMGSFERFSALTLLYFAAMSFSESAWRLGRADLASSFLLSNQEPFALRVRSICDQAGDPNFPLRDKVLETISAVDVAGLSDSSRRNWFPVDSRDLLTAHAKLGVSREIVSDFLARSGF